MSAANGDDIIRIEKKGTRKFQFDGGPVFEIDVIRTLNEWLAIDDGFRDEKFQVPKEKLGAWKQAQANFARDVVRGLGGMDPEGRERLAASLDDAQCVKFVLTLDKIADGLRDFFGVDTGGAPSPAPPSDSATVFTE